MGPRLGCVKPTKRAKSVFQILTAFSNFKDVMIRLSRWYMPIIPAAWEEAAEGSQVQAKVIETLSQKHKYTQKYWGMGQVVECLL